MFWVYYYFEAINDQSSFIVLRQVYEIVHVPTLLGNFIFILRQGGVRQYHNFTSFIYTDYWTDQNPVFLKI